MNFYKTMNLKLSNALISQNFDPRHFDAIKGILISLIVLGHIGSPSGQFWKLQRILYNFHAPLFLLIVFMFPAPKFSLGVVKKRVFRYFTPIAWFSILSFTLFNIFFGAESLSFSAALQEFAVAWVTGAAMAFDVSTGFEAFWFMHALFGLFLIRVISGLGGFLTQAVIIALCILSSCVVSAHLNLVITIPTILTISAYCVLISAPVFMIVNLLRYHFNSMLGALVAWGVFVGLFIYMALTYKGFNLAHVQFPTVFDPINLILFIAINASALSAIIFLVSIAPVRTFFQAIGRLSFEVYLIHLFVLFAAEFTFRRLEVDLSNFAVLIGLFILTSVLIVFLGKVLQKILMIKHTLYLNESARAGI